jgi:type III secretion system FlhB-like substrate exporter
MTWANNHNHEATQNWRDSIFEVTHMIKIAGRIFDQYDDTANEYGFSTSMLPIKLLQLDLIKEAAETDPQAFALEIIERGKLHKKYPYDNPIDAYASAWYLEKTANQLPDSAVRKVASVLLQALEPYKLDTPVTRWLQKVASSEPVKPPVRVLANSNEPLFKAQDQIKTAGKLSYEERKALPDSAFALVKKGPDGGKIRKYPLHDEGHVRAAITFFARHYDKLSPEDRAKVARKIKEKAKEYGIEIGEDSAVSKFASEQVSPGFYEELYHRMQLAKPSVRPMYEELFKVAQDYNPDPVEVAKILDEIDAQAGLKGKVTDPFEAVYKQPSKTVKTAASQPKISAELQEFLKHDKDIMDELLNL